MRLSKPLSDDWQAAKAVFEEKMSGKRRRISTQLQDEFVAHLLHVHRICCKACPSSSGCRRVWPDRHDRDTSGLDPTLLPQKQNIYLSKSTQTLFTCGLQMDALEAEDDDAINDEDNDNKIPLSITCHDQDEIRADVNTIPEKSSNERVKKFIKVELLKEDPFADQWHRDVGNKQGDHGIESNGEKEKDKEQRNDDAMEDQLEDGRPSSLEDHDTQELLADVTSFLERTNQVLGLTIKEERDSRDHCDVEMDNSRHEATSNQRQEEIPTYGADETSHLETTDQVSDLQIKNESDSQDEYMDSSNNESTSHQRLEEEISSQGIELVTGWQPCESDSHDEDMDSSRNVARSHQKLEDEIPAQHVGSDGKTILGYTMKPSSSTHNCDLHSNEGSIRYSQTCQRQYQCPVCGKRFTKKSLITRHMRTHTGEKPFKCDFCSYRCSQKSHLKGHIGTHTGEKPFKCDFCSYRCSQMGNLQNHMRTHTEEKPFKCDYCSYRCSKKQSLQPHITRTHTGEKRFKCDYCSYGCFEKGNLKRHMRTHTGEKPFKCDNCSYSCSEKQCLQRHIRRAHTGEKPFKCNNCSYRCSDKGNLKRHMRTHTGEKPFKCDFCSYRCAVKGYLPVHMRKHTGETSHQ